LADWGLAVTVCIVIKQPEFIIGVSDRKMSADWNSVDSVTVKNEFAGPYWRVMYSANNDTVCMASILRRVHSSFPLPGEENLDTVQGAFREAYQAEVRQRGYDLVLSKYKITVEDFLKDGRKHFGNVEFARLNEEFGRAATLDLELLVYGFDPTNKRQHMFLVKSPGVVNDWDFTNWVAIGSGQYLAAADLAPVPVGFGNEIDALYRALSAKFLAESAPSVGDATFVSILKPDGSEKILINGDILAIKTFWKSEHKLNTPEPVATRLRELLDKTIIAVKPLKT
jgi:hypothetical protein